jgi:Flp pilus assembly protein TadD
MYRNCSGCHHPGDAGPFPLLSFEDVRKHARQIEAVTERRYMPPWPPQEGYGHFQEERRLPLEQIRVIAAWVQAGAPEGTASACPAPPVFPDDWKLGKPDLILRATHPFAVPAGGPDLFWNFTFKPDIKTTSYIRAIEIRPAGEASGAATARLIHHANMLIDRMGSAQRLEATPGAGFPGMELNLDRNPLDPESYFLFWKPGTIPYSEPNGFSWRLDPGNTLVLNTHLQPSGRPESVRPTIALYFADKPPTHWPMLIELEHDGALNIPAGAHDFLVSDDFTLPEDVDVLAIYPHAHYLGKLLEGYATLPGGSRKWLIRIPDWDLNWQAVYRYREPVRLPKGTVISMRFHYDNSAANPRDPNHPPKRIMAGNHATDEMGHLWLQVLPTGYGDRRRELEEAVAHHEIEKYPNDFAAHLNLGAVLLSRLQTQAAITELEMAVRLDNTRPEAHDMLGSGLESVGRTSEAIAQFREAIRVSPNYINARYNLANALAKSGQYKEAVSEFKLVIDSFPDNANLHDRYGQLLARSGNVSAALAEFDKALQIEPTNKLARSDREFVLKNMAATRSPAK